MLALANGVFLYLLPGEADTRYAWSIKPPVNAAFIGAGFLAGTLATGLVLFAAGRWRSLSRLPPALWVLATSLFAATLIHHDRFKFDYPPTWLWVVVYAGVPFAVPVLVYLQYRDREPTPGRRPADERRPRAVGGDRDRAADRRDRALRLAHRFAGPPLAVAAHAAARPRRRRVVRAVRDELSRAPWGCGGARRR